MVLKKYRNRLLQVIQEAGLDPKIFHTEEGKEGSFIVQLIDTQLSFKTTTSLNDFNRLKFTCVLFQPNFPKLIPSTEWMKEDEVIRDFIYWLENHVKPCIQETAEPDLWKLIESQIPLGTESEISQEDTATFSDDEKTRLRMSLNEYRLLLIKNFEPSREELKVIDDRLKYLSDSVDRLNRMDWRSVAFTALIAISTALALDTDKGRLLFDLFKQVFSGLLQLTQ